MKKFTLLLVVLFISLGTFAQKRVTSRAPVDHNTEGGTTPANAGFGIKGGLSWAHVRGNDKTDNIDGRTSYHAGAYSQFSISRIFSVQIEGLYSRKGYKFSSDSTMRLNYIDVPILAVVNLTENISIHAGPQASIMIKAVAENKELDLHNFNTFGYAAAAGAEARVGFARVGARYTLSFEDIWDRTEVLGQRVQQDLKNGLFQVYLGVGF